MSSRATPGRSMTMSTAAAVSWASSVGENTPGSRRRSSVLARSRSSNRRRTSSARSRTSASGSIASIWRMPSMIAQTPSARHTAGLAAAYVGREAASLARV